MIVVDSSAVIAILEGESGEQAFERAIADDDRCLISAVSPPATPRKRHRSPSLKARHRQRVKQHNRRVAAQTGEAVG